MKKRNFAHRLIGMVEQELEATLAVLIVLAAIFGYSLAATNTVTPANLQIAATVGPSQQTFAMGNSSYATLTFDSTLASGASTHYIRTVTISDSAPQDLATVRGKGIIGSTGDLMYEFSIALSSPYTGSVYVWGTYPDSSVNLNGVAVADANTSVQLTNASKLTLDFPGVTANIRAFSNIGQSGGIGGMGTEGGSGNEAANVAVIPSYTSVTEGQIRSFVALVTDSNGHAIDSGSVTIEWSITASSPANIATVNPTTGELTAKKVGVVTVTAAVTNGQKKTASATVTIIAAKTTTPSGSTTGTSSTTTTNTPATPPAQTPAAPAQSILDKLAETLGGSAANAETNTGTQTPTQTATTITNALFSPAVVAERTKVTNQTAPTQAEVSLATRNMTPLQRVATKIQVGLTQVAKDLHEIVAGSVIKDAQGNTVTVKPNAVQLIANKIKTLLSGASAAPTKVSPGQQEGGVQ